MFFGSQGGTITCHHVAHKQLASYYQTIIPVAHTSPERGGEECVVGTNCTKYCCFGIGCGRYISLICHRGYLLRLFAEAFFKLLAHRLRCQVAQPGRQGGYQVGNQSLGKGVMTTLSPDAVGAEAIVGRIIHDPGTHCVGFENRQPGCNSGATYRGNLALAVDGAWLISLRLRLCWATRPSLALHPIEELKYHDFHSF